MKLRILEKHKLFIFRIYYFFMHNKRGVSEPTKAVMKTIIILLLVLIIGYFFVKGVLRLWDVIF